MELIKLKTVSCSSTSRADLSATLRKVVAVIVANFPKDTVVLGRVLPSDRSVGGVKTWWLLGYNLKYHMVFAQPVSENNPAYIMATRSFIRTVEGARCVFNAQNWKAEVETDKYFHELDISKLSDEAIVASFLTHPPERFSLELSYSQFRLSREERNILLPYTSDWVDLRIPAGIESVEIPEGVKHVAITSSLSGSLIRLPETIVSCHIDEEVEVRLSIPKRFAKYWGYWSAVWGKPYAIKEGFSQTPDGLVTVRR